MMKYNVIDRQMSSALPILLLSLLLLVAPLTLNGHIRLFPNTENSPSIYLIPFTLTKALPSASYILITMDWYSAATVPYNCILVNTTISIQCTNLNSPSFAIPDLQTKILAFNSQLETTKTVVVKLGSNLLTSTNYNLQLHLYNVIPNIQKISPSIEMYTVSSNGLIYETNPNIAAVINNPPITNLMAVSTLNDLSANKPGSTSTLRAQITIGQGVSTSLSTLIFVVQHPFTFSLGSIPIAFESSSYSTSPIALFSKPTILSYEIVTPNIFEIVFNQQFAVGRKFILQIDQINNPFLIAATNISIYSLNFNTLTPLEAYQMLYPIATTPYTLTMSLGLPHDAPFQNSMRIYRYIDQFLQVKITVPYTVPDSYSIRLELTSAVFRQGTTHASFESLSYTPVYNYFLGQNILVISKMGPIVAGTTVIITFQIYISTTTIFQMHSYIDTEATISAFSSAKYLYEGLVEGSGYQADNFFDYQWDNRAGAAWTVASGDSYDSSQWMYIRPYPNIGTTSLSAGNYLDIYLSPLFSVENSFDQSQDCRVNGTVNSCLVTIEQNPNYLRLTVKANTTWAAGNPSTFNHQQYTTLYFRKIWPTVAATNKNLYQTYLTLYKSDVVNPTAYHSMQYIATMPRWGQMPGLDLVYTGNYLTGATSNFQTYPGALRLQCTQPSQLNALIVQPNHEINFAFYSQWGFRSYPDIQNQDPYPCASNVPIQCTYFAGQQGDSRHSIWDRVIVRFLDDSFKTTNFHIVLPDTQTVQTQTIFYYQLGFYNKLNKDWDWEYADRWYRNSGNYYTSPQHTQSSLGAEIVGKAGSYRNNVSVNVYNSYTQTGSSSFVILSTKWSFFENGVSSLSTATLAMTTPATFGSDHMAPLAVYMTNDMYFTIIPFDYVSTTSPFTFYLDQVHMPYTYDLPDYYIYVVRRSDTYMVASNSYIMTNGDTLYVSPLQSLQVSCHDNAIGVVNTYCTLTFGTTHPLLANGNIRVSLSGMTVATSTCSLTSANGTDIPVACSSSTDNLNVTAVMTGWEFYPAGTYTLKIYGVGISNTISQSMTLYLYDSSVQYVIETGVRLLMTTVASLHTISLSQILYSYLSPLSSNTMTIKFYLPRQLYNDQEFAFVIGQDLSDVNTEVARLNIVIERQDGTVIFPLYSLDNINYLIIFHFTDPSLLLVGNYTMTIYGILTPASQSNGAFNMIYRRTEDLTYTIVNSANVIFPALNQLIASNMTITSLFNTEGYKQDITITIVNSQLDVDADMMWVVNFPSYYSPHLFQQDAYCMIDTANIQCAIDPNTPYQLIIQASPKTVTAQTPYTLTIMGLSAPRNPYTNSQYPGRYIFIGVLEDSSATAFAERTQILPYQTIQQTISGVVSVEDMIGINPTSLYAFSSLYAKFQMKSSVALTTGSYIFLDLPTEFDNLNNIALNAILDFGGGLYSSTAEVVNRRIQLPLTVNITADTSFTIEFPNLPTPKAPCLSQMSDIIITVTPSDKLTIYSASAVQDNSAPELTFNYNSKYISFNNDNKITITAGTYSTLIPITTNNNTEFESNINIDLSSTGFTFEPSTVFLPIGSKQETFRIGADKSLVPVVYFYTAVKTEETNTHYAITLNMNIEVTNTPIDIPLPTTLDMPLGGCTVPFSVDLANPPFRDLTITHTFDNSIISETDFYPNPLTTPSQAVFDGDNDNATFSFCSTSSLNVSSVALSFFLTGTNFNSYAFSPNSTISINVVNTIANSTPDLTLTLKNQQKTFLDINFTNTVDGIIFYQLMLGQDMIPLDLQSIQIYLKSNTWLLASQGDFLTALYTNERDDRMGQFYQVVSTSTMRFDGLIAEQHYTLCAYIVNLFGVASQAKCLSRTTMAWGSIIKANVRYSRTLNAQELNDVLCFFTTQAGTHQDYLIDMEGNSCGNRSVANIYYAYSGQKISSENRGSSFYLVTNPTLTGTDPSPLAFTNLFDSGTNQLSTSTLTAALSTFSISYLSATYVSTSDIRSLASTSNAESLQVYFDQPSYTANTQTLTITNIQITGSVGTVYFALVLYKQIGTNAEGQTYVNIRMNQTPSTQQILNCLNYNNQPAHGCGRVTYSGVQAQTISFTSIQTDSLYMLYYMPASQYPLRPIVTGTVSEQTVVTYASDLFLTVAVCLLAIFMVIV